MTGGLRRLPHYIHKQHSSVKWHLLHDAASFPIKRRACLAVNPDARHRANKGAVSLIQRPLALRMAARYRTEIQEIAPLGVKGRNHAAAQDGALPRGPLAAPYEGCYELRRVVFMRDEARRSIEKHHIVLSKPTYALVDITFRNGLIA